MAEIPVLSGRQIIKTLETVGYRIVRKRGSHFRLSCPGSRSVTVPDYRSVSKGLLRKILRDADMPVEAFTRLLE